MNAQGESCVTDGAGDHGDDETCVVRAEATLYANATYFHLQEGGDFINIGAMSFSGRVGPSMVLMEVGTMMSFTVQTEASPSTCSLSQGLPPLLGISPLSAS